MGSKISQMMGFSQQKSQKIEAIPPPPPPVPVNKEEALLQQKIKTEKVSNHLQSNADLFRGKQMKYEAKIITLKLKAKELLQNGKTKEAKKILGEVARMQKQLDKIETRRKLIQGQREAVQTHQLDREVIGALEVAHQLTKQDLSSKLEEHIIDAKQNKILQDQINENMRQLVQISQDEKQADQLLEQLENEMKRQNKKKIPIKNVNVANNNQHKKNVNKPSEIDQMLAQL